MDLAQFVADYSSEATKAASLERRRALAEAIECSPATLYQIAKGHRQASPRMARQINKATLGVIPLAAIRPDVWGDDTHES